MPHAFDLERIGAGLPVAGSRAALEAAAAHGALVVTAPPGTGKTTFVPPLVANLVAGRVLLTQPRRVAVRAAARRIASLDGSALGGPVGFTVRGERTVSDATRLEAITPGVLLRRLLSDPALEGVDAVVLDEVHERSVEGDLLLGMLAEVRELRDDLLLVAMSATLDAASVSELLGGAPVVDVPAALHPLVIEHLPAPVARIGPRGVPREFLDHVARTAVAEQARQRADALVFVPTARDVDEVVRRIRDQASVEALPLHGRLPAAQQDRATAGRGPGEPARIVVTTSLAESSLTVPGVRLVIDAGLARENRRDAARDMTGLVTVSASRASLEQRAGRAARQGPGRAVRLFTEAEQAAFPKSGSPEIASADLTDTALLLAAWGTPAGDGLRLLTPPPPAAMQRAVTALRELALIDGEGRTTALGARVARMPVGVREARALMAGAEEGLDRRAVAEVVAALAGDARDSGADLPRLLRQLRDGSAPGAQRWRAESRRLATLIPSGSTGGRGARALGAGSAEDASGAVDREAASATDATGIVTALARPDWIARRVADRSYLLASGTRAALPEGSGLLGVEWLAVREVQRAEGRAADGTGAVIRLAAPIAEADALRLGALRTEREARIDDGRVRVREQRRLGAIVLASTPVAAHRDDVGPAFAAHLRELGLGALHWTDAATALRARLALLRRELGAPWPHVTDELLLEALAPDLASLRADSSLRRVDVAGALRRLLPWPEAARLDELAPERLAVPSGSNARIAYPADADGPPVVAVKLQELFGLAETPRLVQGRVPVLFHLLSPGRAPLAVTDDLASFWNGPYADVRKQMRGRYPKHPWPEDPWTAPATARTTKRMREG